ncbi:MAG: efflux RND transporter periplasmic adaptor subunit [Thiohalospira sp.]
MKTLYIIIFAIVLSACKNNNGETAAEKKTLEPATQESIELTQPQIERAGIKTGKLEQREIADVILCTGKVDALPQNKANVSPAMGGFIKQINYYTGDNVTKGAVMATFQHQDFIDLQQQLMEAKARKDYHYEEYKRQGELTIENAASIKNMQQAKADYLTAEAKYKSLKARIEILGVDTENIEKGGFEQHFSLKAPINGIITSAHGNNGMYISPDTYIFEIVNDKQLILTLNVLEAYLTHIKKGQKIVFKTLNSDKNFETRIERIDNKINENGMVRVFANINNKNREIKTGMFIEAQLLTNERTVYALPEEAVLENEEESIVFIENNNQYTKVQVNKGGVKDGWIEIIDPPKPLFNQKIVIKGGYYLQSVQEIME